VKLSQIIFKNLVLTSQRACCIYISKKNPSVLLGEIIAVISDKDVKYTNILNGQNAEFIMLKWVVHVVSAVI
jgi:hypothetical protein